MKPAKPFPFKKVRPLKPEQLGSVYKTLRRTFGHQKWWPGETPFEVMIGAILTQNTSWTNVEKAIRNLKKANKLSLDAMHQISTEELAVLIKPSGYFNLKSVRLKNFINFIFLEYGGDLARMFLEKGPVLRKKLLEVKGIGPETADSILLYAAGKSFFVIDAYTKRIFLRHRLKVIPDLKKLSSHLEGMTYDDWQKVFTAHLRRDEALYNDFHAQIVHVAKNHCRKSNPCCEGCPLQTYL